VARRWMIRAAPSPARPGAHAADRGEQQGHAERKVDVHAEGRETLTLGAVLQMKISKRSAG